MPNQTPLPQTRFHVDNKTALVTPNLPSPPPSLSASELQAPSTQFDRRFLRTFTTQGFTSLVMWEPPEEARRRGGREAYAALQLLLKRPQLRAVGRGHVARVGDGGGGVDREVGDGDRMLASASKVGAHGAGQARSGELRANVVREGYRRVEVVAEMDEADVQHFGEVARSFIAHSQL